MEYHIARLQPAKEATEPTEVPEGTAETPQGHVVKTKKKSAPYGMRTNTPISDGASTIDSRGSTPSLDGLSDGTGGAGGGSEQRPTELECSLRQFNVAPHLMFFVLTALRRLEDLGGEQSAAEQSRGGSGPDSAAIDAHCYALSPAVKGLEDAHPTDEYAQAGTLASLHALVPAARVKAGWQFAWQAGVESARVLAGPNTGGPSSGNTRTTTPVVQPSLLWRAVCSCVLALAFGLRLVLGGVLRAVNYDSPPWVPWFGGRSLRRVSATAAQLDRLATQAAVWPSVLVRARRMREQWHLPQHTVLHAVAVGGTIALTVLDLVAGVCAALYIWHEASLGADSQLLALMHRAGQLLHVEVLKRIILWLSVVPAGLKLNEPLTAQLSSLLLQLLSLWNSLTTFLTPLEPIIAGAVGFSGLFGLSLLLAVLADILHAITTHVFLFYYFFAALWRQMLSVAVSLFYLFRNKKFNVLRNRVDTAQSDVAQLLQGVLLFSLVLLLPTVGVYYAFFTVVWGSILAVQAALWCSIAVVTRFPFYGLGVRALRPGCMPGGVRVRLCLADGCDLSVPTAAEEGGGDSAPTPSSNDSTAEQPAGLDANHASTSVFTVPKLKLGSSASSTAKTARDTYLWLHPFGAPAWVLLDTYMEAMRSLAGKHYSPGKIIKGALTGYVVPLAPQDTFDRLRDGTPASRKLPVPTMREYLWAVRTLVMRDGVYGMGAEDTAPDSPLSQGSDAPEPGDMTLS